MAEHLYETLISVSRSSKSKQNTLIYFASICFLGLLCIVVALRYGSQWEIKDHLNGALWESCSSIENSAVRICFSLDRIHDSTFFSSAPREDFDDDTFYDCTSSERPDGNASDGENICSNLIWPMPKSYLVGHDGPRRSVSSSITFELVGGLKESQVMLEAIHRYTDLIFSHGPSDDSLENDEDMISGTISRIRLSAETASDEAPPDFDTDESYEIFVPRKGTNTVYMNATTVYGLLHGLETLSQLVAFDTDSTYVIENVPIHIRDAPRFKYRGLMVDCARHFMPIKFLHRVVDTMAYSKLNVLHLHLSDQESFPLKFKKFPHLWDTAFSTGERYTKTEMRELVKYAHYRGVAVMPEFDTPSHSRSMCSGAPTGVCMASCSKNNMPLRPVDHAFQFVDDLWGEVLSSDGHHSDDEMFPFSFAHSGGDEVKTFCWDDDNVSANWMLAHNMTSSDTYRYFINRNIDIISKYGKRPIIWNDGFNLYGTEIDQRAILMFWTSTAYGKYFKAAAAAGREIIAATSNPLYLSNANEYTSKLYYEYDPCDCSNVANSNNCVNTTAECSRIIGMETAFWTSDYDASNLEPALWPRALAMAERAWSPQHLKYYTNGTTQRLGKFRCSMLERGAAVLPLSANWNHKYGANRPGESGSCLFQ